MRYDLPFAHPIQSNPTGCLASSSDKIQCNTAATKIGNPFCIIVYIAIWRNHETERAEKSIKYFLIEPTKSKKGVLIERIEKERKKGSIIWYWYNSTMNKAKRSVEQLKLKHNVPSNWSTALFFNLPSKGTSTKKRDDKTSEKR